MNAVYFEIFKSRALDRAIRSVGANIWALSESQLEQNFDVSPILIELKIRYWELAMASAGRKSSLKLRNLYEGICSYTNLYNHVLFNPYKLVWILSPAESLRLHLERLQTVALAHIYERLQSNQLDDHELVNLINNVIMADP